MVWKASVVSLSVRQRAKTASNGKLSQRKGNRVMYRSWQWVRADIHVYAAQCWHEQRGFCSLTISILSVNKKLFRNHGNQCRQVIMLEKSSRLLLYCVNCGVIKCRTEAWASISSPFQIIIHISVRSKDNFGRIRERYCPEQTRTHHLPHTGDVGYRLSWHIGFNIDFICVGRSKYCHVMESI
jgi:hypothetical protein